MIELVRVAARNSTKLLWEPQRLHPRADEILFDENLPADSVARTLRFQFQHILIRPYSPQGFRDIDCLDGETRTLYLEKDSRWPKIWGWPLAITKPDFSDYPIIVPGKCMLVFKRFGDELLGEDRPCVERYLGHVLPVRMIHLENLECVFTPPPIAPEY